VSESTPDLGSPWTILVLSRFPEKILPALAQFEDRFVFSSHREVTLEFLETHGIDRIVCFGYGRVLSDEILDAVTGINLHWSILPYCRGPFPHIWSVLEDVPFGTSIHYLTPQVDGGDLIAQRPVEIDREEATLQELFDRLVDASADLFGEAWPGIRYGINARLRQPMGGSSHTRRRMAPLKEFLESGAEDLQLPVFRERALELLEES